MKPGDLVRLCLMVVLAFSMAACQTAPTHPATASVAIAATRSPSPLPAPTATRGSPKVEAVSASMADGSQPSQARDTLQTLATGSGMDFEVVPSLDSASLPDEVVLLIILDNLPADLIRSTAASRADLRVVAPAADGLTGGANLTLLTPPEDLAVRQAFLAGYAAALVTEDWRTAILIPDRDPLASQEATAFRNGGIYFCGLCRPVRPPFVDYPLDLRFNPGPSGLSGVFDGTGVATVFIPASAEGPDLLAGLQSGGLKIIGTAPPSTALAASWVGSVATDPIAAIAAGWGDLLGSQPPATLTLPVVVQDVNSDLLSPGRLRLVEEAQSNLAQDLIDPLDQP